MSCADSGSVSEEAKTLMLLSSIQPQCNQCVGIQEERDFQMDQMPQHWFIRPLNFFSFYSAKTSFFQSCRILSSLHFNLNCIAYSSLSFFYEFWTQTLVMLHPGEEFVLKSCVTNRRFHAQLKQWKFLIFTLADLEGAVGLHNSPNVLKTSFFSSNHLRVGLNVTPLRHLLHPGIKETAPFFLE